jgi:ABC-type Fe3+-siderophore transport system permease subunit
MTPREEDAIGGWFLRNGVPQLVADYDPREDTLTRLQPVLVVLFVLALALVLRPDWAWWQRVLAVLVGASLAVAGLVLANVLRRRRPFARPERVGFVEALVVVFTPAVASLVLGDDPARAGWIALGSAGVAVAAYALTSLGVLAPLLSQGWPAFEGLRDTFAVAVRALPPLLAVLLFLSLTQETWQAFGDLEGWRFGSVLIGFGLLTVVILLVGLRAERADLASPKPGPELAQRARQTPAAPLVERGVEPVAPPLDRIERINLAVALLVTLALRVLVVGAVVGGAFFIFGLLVVDEELTEEWAGAANVFLSISIAGREVVVTEALLRVAIVLGAFAALYFAAVALGDARNRESFLDDLLERFRRVMAAWSYYRGALSARPGRGAAA